MRNFFIVSVAFISFFSFGFENYSSSSCTIHLKSGSFTKGTKDINSIFTFKAVYFDKDSYELREEAKAELQKVLEVMKANPSIKIEVRSHTDSRNSEEESMKLSIQRSFVILNWLVANGIDSNRLIAKGFGKSQLINRCSDGVPCSEEQHQENRRSEFVISEI